MRINKCKKCGKKWTCNADKCSYFGGECHCEKCMPSENIYPECTPHILPKEKVIFT